MRRVFLYTNLIVSLSLFHPGFAQKFNPFYNFKQLNVENGLAQNVVYHFLQDSRGYMWLGTRNGISLFDGIRTKNFLHDDHQPASISGNFITRIIEDANHKIWIGTNAGIDQYDEKQNAFHHYGIERSDGKLYDTYCVPLGFINDHELFLIETESKAIRAFNIKTKKFRFICSTNAVDGTIYCKPDSDTVHFWSYLSIGTTHLAFKNDSLIAQRHFFENNRTIDADSSLLIYHVFIQSDSIVWLSTAKGLIELNTITNTHHVYDNLAGQSVKEIRFARLSSGGLLWVSTGGSGIFTFDIKTKKFIDNFRNDALDPYSICSNNIVSLYFDVSGNIWCGSYGDGASYANVRNNYFSKFLSKHEMQHWKEQNGVRWVGEDAKENVWCILQNILGVWELDSTLRVKAYHKPVSEDGKALDIAIHQMLFDGESLAWCTSNKGLFLYNTQTNRIREVRYPVFSDELFGSNWSTVMIRLHDNSILFSTMSGLYRIHSRDGKEIVEPFSSINKKEFKSFDLIYEDSERNIYVKDIGENLYVLKDSASTGNYIIAKQFDFPADVTEFTEDKTEVYMATGSGLFLLNKKNETLKKSPINEQMPFSAIANVLVEGGKIWLFGDKGLYCFDRSKNNGRLFTAEDGLPANKFYEFCMMTTSSGRCLAGTNNGLLAFYPSAVNDTIHPPRPQIINMFVNDSANGFLPNAQENAAVTLSHDQNTFSFDFSCISFQHAEACTYLYKLDHFDEKWIAGGNTHYTRYSKIPPGKYIFQLKVIDPSGKESPFTKTMDITITKAFWQTTTFKIISAVILAAIILLLIKSYLRTRIQKHQRAFEKQQAIEKERTRIATDMHDDLGAGLSRIKFLSETIGIKKQLQQPVEEEITSISGYANEMIGKMGEIIWALNEKNDSLSDLLSYTRSYAVEYLLTNGIESHVNAPAVFPSIFVSGEFRRNVYLSIKEALHNVVKHAQATRVIITIEINKYLQISIQDDGVGFDVNNKRPFSNGISNMQKRMKDIGGNLEIIQKNGTLVVLTTPLP